MLFEAKGLSYRYSDGTSALEGVDMEVSAGARIAVLGANGSGKSTLLRLLDGLIFPAAGTLTYEGRELSESSLRDLDFRAAFRQNVGFVFQNADAMLFNATVGEELAFGPRQLGLDEPDVAARVTDVLRFLGIEHLSERPPFRLSGGEKRKVAIASVLTMNPQVLILDEPFLGLDPRSLTWLVRTLQQLHRIGKTTILATHTLTLVPEVADTAVVLSEDHRSIAAGSVESVLQDEDLLRRANLVA